jgi:hypothetical protein
MHNTLFSIRMEKETEVSSYRALTKGAKEVAKSKEI